MASLDYYSPKIAYRLCVTKKLAKSEKNKKIKRVYSGYVVCACVCLAMGQEHLAYSGPLSHPAT